MKKIIFKLNVLVILGIFLTIPTTVMGFYGDSYLADLYNPMTDNQGFDSTYMLPQIYGGMRGYTNIGGLYNLNSWGLGFAQYNPFVQYNPWGRWSPWYLFLR